MGVARKQGGMEVRSCLPGNPRCSLEDGYEVSTAHLAESNVVAMEKVIDLREVIERDTAWIRACGIL